MALSPENSRAQMLGAAIREATYVLGAPIDKLVVEQNGKVTLWAGRRKVTSRPRLNQNYKNGEPALGGGSWETAMGPVETEPPEA